jgi:quinolinate synthase
VESLGADKVIFLPDQYMAKYVQTKTKVQIISWVGTCIVHERFSAQEVEDVRKQNPNIVVLAHPECPPEVIAASDFTGSTSGMSNYVKKNQPKKVMLVTECSMSDNVQVDNPNVQFIKPCNLCPHMKTITLSKVLECLEKETNEILIPEIISKKAQKAVERMIAVGRSH